MGNPRYAPCRILLERSIPSMVWMEDAVARYGVPIVVFDLHLIVPGIDKASAILRESGWSYYTPSCYPFLSDTTSKRWKCLLSPPVEDTSPVNDSSPTALPLPTKIPAERVATVLFSAAEWGIAEDTLNNAIGNKFFPLLPMLIDTLIDGLLDAPIEGGLYTHICIVMGYLYRYVPQLQDKAFADQLDPVHRQFHFDCVSKQFMGWAIPSVKHERIVRDMIRTGKYELTDCSAFWKDDNQILFDDC
ncbi:hypothetical protein F5Y10DRAFT_248059 [Nemania abortiva]|nr:hypothetical protein F5Y10DRAFT_248059 [Nemania abortiva]